MPLVTTYFCASVMYIDDDAYETHGSICRATRRDRHTAAPRHQALRVSLSPHPSGETHLGEPPRSCPPKTFELRQESGRTRWNKFATGIAAAAAASSGSPPLDPFLPFPACPFGAGGVRPFSASSSPSFIAPRDLLLLRTPVRPAESVRSRPPFSPRAGDLPLPGRDDWARRGEAALGATIGFCVLGFFRDDLRRTWIQEQIKENSLSLGNGPMGQFSRQGVAGERWRACVTTVPFKIRMIFTKPNKFGLVWC